MIRGWSIRRRLLAALVALLLIGLGGAPVVASYLVGDFLQQRGEDRLRAVSTIVGGVVSGRDRVVLDDNTFGELPGLTNMVVVALDADGHPVATLDRLGPGIEDEATSQLSDELAAVARPGEVTTSRVGDRPFMLVKSGVSGLFLRTADGSTVEIVSVVAAYDRSQDVAVVRRLERVGFGFAAVALGVLGLIAALVLRRGLRPLEQMAEEVSNGDGSDLAALGRAGGVETARLGEALEDAFAARRRAEGALRDFVADASHELRTPLATMSGWLDLWAQGGLEDAAEREAAMGRIEAEVGRMRLLVDDLSLLARLDRGRPLDLELVDLRPVMADILDDARVVDPQRSYRLDAVGPLVVRGDHARLMQVFRNLVGNATEHTPAGTAVEIRAAVDGSAVRVAVHDHGPGIPAGDLERVFERFHRSSVSRNAGAAPGSGLGLAIVRSIVEAHGGRVGATSVAGQGTTVTVELPSVSESSGPP